MDDFKHISQAERRLRRMLCIAVAKGSPYMDDGEAQDNSMFPCIDFLRDSPEQIQSKLMERAIAKHKARSAIPFSQASNDMDKIIIPAIGTPMPKLGGTFWGIQRALPGSGQPDYALIVPHGTEAQAQDIAWGGYGDDEPAAACMYDGQANTRALVASAVDHPAAQFCAALSIDGFNDFYLPSLRELKTLFGSGCDAFDTEHWYWSSTQFSRYYAYLQYFNYGDTLNSFKDWTSGFARAVRRVPIHELIGD